MEHAYSVKLSKIVKDLDVELIYSPYDLNDVKISSIFQTNINAVC